MQFQGLFYFLNGELGGNTMNEVRISDVTMKQVGKGFSLSLGANVFVGNVFIQAEPYFFVMPKLNLGFSF